MASSGVRVKECSGHASFIMIFFKSAFTAHTKARRPGSKHEYFIGPLTPSRPSPATLQCEQCSQGAGFYNLCAQEAESSSSRTVKAEGKPLRLVSRNNCRLLLTPSAGILSQTCLLVPVIKMETRLGGRNIYKLHWLPNKSY